jgi:FKBP-type peptidyl-prolyl cis-trans isomerase 2
MAFKDGEFLEVDYSVYDAASSGLLATTDEKRAKEANIFNEKMKYGAVLMVVGSSGLIKGLDREIRGMNAKETKRLAFKPEEAFGQRSEDLVRVMPLSDFRERDIDPYPGMTLELDNTTATVRSVNSGRVVVDANHPFAGKDIVYEVTIQRLLTSDKDKIEALGKSYGIAPSSIASSDDRVEVSFNDGIAKNADYFIGKTSLVASVFNYFDKVKRVEVKEEYIRKEEQKK